MIGESRIRNRKSKLWFAIFFILMISNVVSAQYFNAVDGGFVPGNSNLIWFTAAKFTGIFLWDGKNVDTLTMAQQSGFRPAFMTKDDTLFVAWKSHENDQNWIEFTTRPGSRTRKVSQPSRKTGVPVWTAENLLFSRDESVILVDPFTGDVFNSWYGIDAHVVLWSRNGLIYTNKEDELILYNFAGEESKLTQSGIRVYGPIMSPDEKTLIVNCLGMPDYIMDMSTLKLTKLPDGDEFRFDCDGKRIVFLAMKDDGEKIISSDVKILENNKVIDVSRFWGEKIPIRADICGYKLLVITDDGEIIVGNWK